MSSIVLPFSSEDSERYVTSLPSQQQTGSKLLQQKGVTEVGSSSMPFIEDFP